MLKKSLLSLACCVVLGLSLESLALQNAQPIKEWNLLVYVNGVNNLDSYGSMNINQMEEHGSNENMNILVDWGSYSFNTAKRLLIQKDNDTKKVTSPVVNEVQNPDFGSSTELLNFIKWAETNYPAKHYFVVVWNHGNGWHIQKDIIHVSDISYDDRTGNHITTEQLGQTMKDAAQFLGHKVDIYGSDACLMGMAEVADEMSDSVSYFVGSQDLEPGEGWPYNTFIQKWQASPNMSAADIAKLLSHEYTAAYNPGGIYGSNSVTMSAFDLEQIGGYKAAIKSLALELKALPADVFKRVLSANTSTKYFYMRDYKDNIDFLDQLEKNSIQTNSSSVVRESYSKFLLSNDQNQDQVTHGLSIWLPTSKSTLKSYLNRYKNLNFNKGTDWADLLALMYP